MVLIRTYLVFACEWEGNEEHGMNEEKMEHIYKGKIEATVLNTAEVYIATKDSK